MKLSDELVQGFALGEPTLKAIAEQTADETFMEIDAAFMGPEASVKARFRELLEQHPKLTRPQAYAQAVMGICEPAIGATVASFALAKKDDTMMGPPVMRVVSAGEVLSITFPQDVTLEDFDRMGVEIRMALDQAERRGEQKALAFLLGEGSGPVLGVLHQEDTPHADATLQVGVDSVIDRFEELLSEHPELTRGQAYIQAVMEAGNAVIAEVVEEQ